MRWVNPEYSSSVLEGPDGSVWLMQLKVSRDELTRVLAMYSANEIPFGSRPIAAAGSCFRGELHLEWFLERITRARTMAP
jgi:hypothetical protein